MSDNNKRPGPERGHVWAGDGFIRYDSGGERIIIATLVASGWEVARGPILPYYDDEGRIHTWDVDLQVTSPDGCVEWWEVKPMASVESIEAFEKKNYTRTTIRSKMATWGHKVQIIYPSRSWRKAYRILEQAGALPPHSADDPGFDARAKRRKEKNDKTQARLVKEGYFKEYYKKNHVRMRKQISAARDRKKALEPPKPPRPKQTAEERREKQRDYDKKRREQKGEEVRAYYREYYRKNRDKICAQQKQRKALRKETQQDLHSAGGCDIITGGGQL